VTISPYVPQVNFLYASFFAPELGYVPLAERSPCSSHDRKHHGSKAQSPSAEDRRAEDRRGGQEDVRASREHAPQEGERGGVFLEMGAGDGVLFSNTLLFERCFGWHGGLILLVALIFLASPPSFLSILSFFMHACLCQSMERSTPRLICWVSVALWNTQC
jgi:hypothetical protein